MHKNMPQIIGIPKSKAPESIMSPIEALAGDVLGVYQAAIPRGRHSQRTSLYS